MLALKNYVEAFFLCEHLFVLLEERSSILENEVCAVAAPTRHGTKKLEQDELRSRRSGVMGDEENRFRRVPRRRDSRATNFGIRAFRNFASKSIVRGGFSGAVDQGPARRFKESPPMPLVGFEVGTFRPFVPRIDEDEPTGSARLLPGLVENRYEPAFVGRGTGAVVDGRR